VVRSPQVSSGAGFRNVPVEQVDRANLIEVVRVYFDRTSLACDKAAPGNINRWRDFPNIMGRRKLSYEGSSRKQIVGNPKNKILQVSLLLHWEAPRGPHVNPGGPTVERAFVSILALELGPRSMLSAGLKVPWVDIARLGFA